MTRSVVVVAGTGNKELPTVNIVTSAQVGADNATSITPGTSEHKKVQATSSTVKGLKTLCVPNYSGGGGGGGGGLPPLPDGFSFVVQDLSYVTQGSDFVITEI